MTIAQRGKISSAEEQTWSTASGQFSINSLHSNLMPSPTSMVSPTRQRLLTRLMQCSPVSFGSFFCMTGMTTLGDRSAVRSRYRAFLNAKLSKCEQ